METKFTVVLDQFANSIENSAFDAESKRTRYSELKYLLEGLDSKNSKPQLIGGLNSGWYLIDPETLEAVDVDSYVDHYADEHGLLIVDYFDFYDQFEADPQKYWQEAQKLSLVQALVDLV